MGNDSRIGDYSLHFGSEHVQGKFIRIDGEEYYHIEGVDALHPFFISLVSDSDHWLFLSSHGGLTAGRRDPAHALFPYGPEDRIHDSRHTTGPLTILRIRDAEGERLWEPFSDRYEGIYRIERSISKSVFGDKIRFEERNHDLQLSFQYTWSTSERFGFVRRSELQNTGSEKRNIHLLDGLRNILPAGTDELLQLERSVLLDAYKKHELLPASGLGLFTLSAVPVDRAEPSEALRANVVWSSGLTAPQILLSGRQLHAFRRGETPQQEVDLRAGRGAYFVCASLALEPGEKRSWSLVAALELGSAEVANLDHWLRENPDAITEVEADVRSGTERLIRLVAGADGLQHTAFPALTHRHFANSLFNIMRGGLPEQAYRIRREDLIDYVRTHNRQVCEAQIEFLNSLPERFDLHALQTQVEETDDVDLQRLCREYLPFFFSRRHGDPSRPWNRFLIDVRQADGSTNLSYEGNWRDIFQNWEALAFSYPGWLDGMIARFLNASTADGYNPYRITRDGIDWEITDPSDPWSYIGYWGDHQIIYLLKLLEQSSAYEPGHLAGLLHQRSFVYADVPYRIRNYEALCENPRDTVDFDAAADAASSRRRGETGADGNLLRDQNGTIVRANLTEKLLAPLLAKLSNFVPEGGIWLNTQRPEWNDANNALVGNGLSMVTLYYLRRHIAFLLDLFDGGAEHYAIAQPLYTFYKEIHSQMTAAREILDRSFSDQERRAMMDGLGRAGSSFREQLYDQGLGTESEELSTDELREFLQLAQAFLEHSIRANRRKDGLYHAYNLLDLNADRAGIDRLYPMLEGQVAVLSSAYLEPAAALEVLEATRSSDLFREDQSSYLLYPDRELARFADKNVIPPELLDDAPLTTALQQAGNRDIIERDTAGALHFHSDFRHADDLRKALEALPEKGFDDGLVSADTPSFLAAWESVFNHREFTGRSGTFFGYEGLGCIYWHMVSKLLLSAGENCRWALEAGADPVVLGRLIDCYYDIRHGLGFNKSPAEYGAFPTDPYSHTPGDGTARQPGMTGQVKEDLLGRFGELGVVVRDGCLHFDGRLLRASEFTQEPASFECVDQPGVKEQLALEAGSLAFTVCQVPVIYRKTKNETGIQILTQSETLSVEGLSLDRETSTAIFMRTGLVRRIMVDIVPGLA